MIYVIFVFLNDYYADCKYLKLINLYVLKNVGELVFFLECFWNDFLKFIFFYEFKRFSLIRDTYLDLDLDFRFSIFYLNNKSIYNKKRLIIIYNLKDLY